MFAHTCNALAHFGAEVRDALPHNVVSVHAFGSRVRGDHRGDSDLDVLVVVRERTLEVERSIIDLCVEHEQRSLSADDKSADALRSGLAADL